MSWRDDLGPRDPAGAARAVFSLVAVWAGVDGLALAMTDVQPAGMSDKALSIVVLLFAAGTAWALRHVSRADHPLWIGLPFIWIATIVLLALTSRGAYAHGEVFLFFPAMYSARQLRQSASVPLIAVCAGLSVVIAAASEHPRSELSFVLFFTPTMLVISLRLTETGKRFDTLLAELKTLASTDRLTGLGTRHVLDLASQSIGDASQPAGQALLLIDIDRFKTINDGHGHPAGDAILVQLAELLRVNIRASDVPCRIGGDELAVLCHGLSKVAASHRAEDICRQTRRRPFRLPDGSFVQLTISIGVAHHCGTDIDFQSMYERADLALYKAKRGGRNKVVVLSTTSGVHDISHGVRAEQPAPEI